jgi:hypothetical protein
MWNDLDPGPLDEDGGDKRPASMKHCPPVVSGKLAGATHDTAPSVLAARSRGDE